MFAFDEWLRHRMVFNIIRNVGFFRNFYILRAFQNWRANVRAQLFVGRQETVSASALQLLPIFGPSLQRITSALVSFSDAQRWERKPGEGGGWCLRSPPARGGAGGSTLMHRLSTFRTEAPCMLHEFKELRQERVREGQRSFQSLVATAKQEIARVEGEVQRVTEALENDTGAELSETSRRGRWRSESMTFRKEATRKSQARQQQVENVKLLLSRFIRTLDALVVRGVLAFAGDACNIFREELRVGRKISLFNVVGATDLGLHDLEDIHKFFEPSVAELSGALAGVLSSVFQLAAGVERISQADSDFVERCFIPLGEILSHTLPFEELYASARGTLEKDYDAAMLSDTVQRFKAANTMHAFASVWTENEYQKRGPTPDDFCQDITGIRKWRHDLSRGKNVIISGMVHVDTSRLKAMWLSPAVRALEGLTSLLAGKFIQHCKSVTEWLQIHSEGLQNRPEELSHFATYVISTKEHTDADGKMKQHYLSDISTAQNLQELLSQGGAQGPWTPGGECQEWWGQTERMQTTYVESRNEALGFMESFTPEAVSMLLNEASSLSQRLQSVITEVRNGPSVRTTGQPATVLRGLQSYSRRIDKESELAAQLTMYQTILGSERLEEMERTLDGVKVIIARHIALWRSWEEWKAFDLRLQKTNVLWGDFVMNDEIDERVGVLLASMSRHKLEVKDEQAGHEHNTPLENSAISAMEKDALLWREHSAALRYTCSPAMQYRHWITVLRKAGRPAPARLTVKNLLEWNILTHPSLVRVWTQSQREAELEEQLHSLMEAVKGNDLLFSDDFAYKVWSCQRATNVHEILLVLHQARKQLSGLSCSPHLPEVFDAFQEVEANILHICKTLSLVADCQDTWELLAKIFSHQAYFDYAPGAGLAFKTVTQSWNTLVVSMSEAPGVYRCCKCTTLEECERLQQELSKLTKRCSGILQGMRETFPRLYFADNVSLIHVAASISPKDIDFAQLESVFSGLSSISFNADVENGNPDAAEKWEVTAAHFQNEISLQLEGCTLLRGELPELWLSTIQDKLCEGIKASFEACLTGCATMKPLEWCTVFPSQSVLLVDDVVWTDTVSAVLNSMSSGNKFAVQNLFQQATRRVEGIRKTIHSLMFEVGHNMTQNEIQACLRSQRALFVAGIEHRDFADSLNGSQISGIDDYEWLKQMRYYWDIETKGCSVHTGLLSRVEYGFECLGDSVSDLISHSRSQLLNVASLTGQSPFICLRNCSVRPVISRSLAAAYGQYCPEVRCMEDTDMSSLGRVLNGIATTAAWVCFYNIDALACGVVSQLALELNAIKMVAHLNRPHLPWGDFNCFVTTREVSHTKNIADLASWSCRSLIVPQAKSSTILEAALGAYGFPEPASLASRTLLFFQSVYHCMPREKCFNHISKVVRSLVSYISKAAQDREDVRPLLKEAVTTLWVSALEEAHQLAFWDLWQTFKMDPDTVPGDGGKPETTTARFIMENMLRTKQCVVITGAPGSGKSKLIREVTGISRIPFQKMSRNFTGHHSIGAEIAPRVLYHGAMPLEAVLGGYEASIWKDGKLADFLKTPESPDSVNQPSAIVFDGAMCCPQVELVLSMLQDSHATLPNGEEIRQADFNKILFETTSIAGASPTMIGTVGVVHCRLDTPVLGAVVDEVCEEACQRCATSWVPQEALLSAMECLPLIAASVKEAVPSLNGNEVAAAVRRCGYLFQEMAVTSPDAVLVLTNEERTLFTYKIFVYSSCWAFGSSLQGSERRNVQVQILEVVPDDWAVCVPEGRSIFDDCQIDFYNFDICEWAESPDSAWSKACVNQFGELFIPTRKARAHTFAVRWMMDAGLIPWVSGSGLSTTSALVRTALDGSFQGLNSREIISCRLNGKSTIKDINRILGVQMELCGSDLLRPKYGGEAVIFIEDLHLPHTECVINSNKPTQDCSEVSEWLRQLMDSSAYYVESTKRIVSKAKLILSGNMSQNASNLGFERLRRFFDLVHVDDVGEMDDATSKWIFSYFCNTRLPRFLSPNTRVSIALGAEEVLRKILEIKGPKNSYLKTAVARKVLLSISRAASLLNEIDLLQKDNYARNFLCLWTHQCFYALHEDRGTDLQDSLLAAFTESAKSVALACSPNGPQPNAADVESDIRQALGLVGVTREGVVTFPLIEEIRVSISEEVLEGAATSNVSVDRQALFSLLKKPHLVGHVQRIAHQLKSHPVCLLVSHTCDQKAMAISAAYLLGTRIAEVALSSSLSTEGVWETLQEACQGGSSCAGTGTLVFVEDEACADRDILGAIVTFFQNDCFSHGSGAKLLLNISPAKYAEIETFHTGLLSLASVLHVHETNDNDMFQAILDILKTSRPLVEGAVEFGWHVPSVSWSLVQIHHSAAEVWDSAFPASDISQRSIWECLETFEAEIGRRLYALREKSSILHRALIRFDEADTQAHEARKSIDQVEPRLGNVVSNSMDSVLNISDLERLGDDLNIENFNDEIKCKKWVATMDEMMLGVDNAINVASEKYVTSLTQVLALAEKDIVELRSYNSPPGLVRIVVESVCVLFNVDKSWKAARKFIADKDESMLDRVENFNLDGVSEATFAELDTYVSLPNFKPSAVEQVSQAAKSICEWVLAVHGYTVATKEARESGIRTHEIRAQKESCEDKIAQRKLALEEITTQLSILQHKHSQLLSQQGSLETERESLNHKVEVLRRFLQDFRPQAKQWQEEYVDIMSSLNESLGSSILMSAYMVYCSAMLPEQRSRCVAKWTAILEAQGIKSGPVFDVVSHSAKQQHLTHLAWASEMHNIDCENMILLDLSNRDRHRVALLVDPDGLAMTMVEGLYPGLAWQHAAADSHIGTGSSGLGAALKTITSGTNVLLEINKLTPDMVGDLRASCAAEENGGKLVLFTRSQALPLFPSAHEDVAIINCERDHRAVAKTLLRAAVQTANGETHAAANRLTEALGGLESGHRERQSEILSKLCEDNGSASWLSLERLNALIDMKSKEIALVDKINSTKSDLVEHRLHEKRWAPIAEMLKDLYFRFRQSQLVLLSEVPVCPLWQYEKICSRIIEAVSCEGNEEPLEETDILAATCRRMYPQLRSRYGQFGRVGLGLAIASQLLISGDSASAAECAFLEDSLMQTSSTPEAAVQSLERYPGSVFHGHLDEIREYVDSVEDVDVSGVSSPRLHISFRGRPILENFSDFHRTVLVATCFKSFGYLAAEWFVKQAVRPESEPDQSTSLCDAALVFSPDVPIFIYGCEGESCARPLEYAGKLFKRLQAPYSPYFGVVFHSIGLGTYSGLKESLHDARKKGKWLVILEADTNPVRCNALVRELSSLAKGAPGHELFKVWICAQGEHLGSCPLNLFCRSSVFALEPLSNAHQGVVRAFDSLEGENRKMMSLDGEEPAAWRKHAFGLSLLNAVLKMRHSYGDLGYHGHVTWSDQDFMSELDVCRVLFAPKMFPETTKPHLFDYTAINSLIMDTLSPVLENTWDQRCCRSLIDKFITHDILTPSYIVCDPSQALGTMPPLDDVVKIRDFIQTVIASVDDQEVFSSVSSDLQTQVRGAKFSKRVLESRHSMEFSWPLRRSVDVERLATILEDVLERVDGILRELEEEVTPCTELLSPSGDREGAPADPFRKQIEASILREISEFRHQLLGLRQTASSIQGHMVDYRLPRLLSQAAHYLLSDRLPVGSAPGPKDYHSLGDFLRHIGTKSRLLTLWLGQERPAINLGMFSEPDVLIAEFKQVYAEASGCTPQEVLLSARILDRRETSREYFVGQDATGGARPADEGGEPAEEQWSMPIDGVHLCGALWDQTNKYLTDVKGSTLITKLPNILLSFSRERPEQDLNHYVCPVYVAMRPQSSGPPTVLWNLEMKSRRNVDFWLRKGVAAYAVA